MGVKKAGGFQTQGGVLFPTSGRYKNNPGIGRLCFKSQAKIRRRSDARHTNDLPKPDNPDTVILVGWQEEAIYLLFSP